MKIAKAYKQKMLKHSKGTQLEQQLQSVSRIVRFRLSPSRISCNYQQPPINQQNNKTRNIKRSNTMYEGILKKKSSFNNKHQLRAISMQLNPQNEDEPIYTVKNEHDCMNYLYNNKIKSEYYRKLEMLKIYKYVDQYFPPNFSSMFPQRNHQSPNNIFNEITSQVEWMRISQVFPPSIFKLVMFNSLKSTSFNFISKGSDMCPDYLVEAMNCLRFNDFVLTNIFGDQEYNDNGIYYVNLFHQDKWETIIIDDYIPVLPRKNKTRKNSMNRTYHSNYKPLFSYCSPKFKKKGCQIQIWHYLLQKAYAKLYSCYCNILNGNVFDFIWDSTGLNFQSQLTINSTVNWKQVPYEAFLMGLTATLKTVSITMSPNKERASYVVPGKQGFKQTIWVQDIPSFFPYIYIWGSKQYTYWSYSNIRNHDQDQISVRSFELESCSLCNISLVQKDKKLFHHSGYNNKYSWIRVILLEQQFDSNYRWIEGIYSNNRIIKFDVDLNPGKYLILIISEQQDQAYPLSLVCKSMLIINLQKQKYIEGCLEKGCADMAQRFGRLNQLNKNLCSYNCIHEDMGMIVQNINNERAISSVKIKRSISGLKPTLNQLEAEPINIQAFNPQFKGKQSMEVEIPGSGEYTVILLMKGGIDKKFFDGFNFRTKSNLNK